MLLTGNGGSHVIALVAEFGAVVSAPADVGRTDRGQTLLHLRAPSAAVIALFNTITNTTTMSA